MHLLSEIRTRSCAENVIALLPICFSLKMYAVNANGVPVVIAAHPMQFDQDKQRPYSTMRNDYAKQLIVLGSLQIVLGVLSIVFEAVSLGIFVQEDFHIWPLVGYGFWIGILVSALSLCFFMAIILVELVGSNQNIFCFSSELIARWRFVIFFLILL